MLSKINIQSTDKSSMTLRQTTLLTTPIKMHTDVPTYGDINEKNDGKNENLSKETEDDRFIFPKKTVPACLIPGVSYESNHNHTNQHIQLSETILFDDNADNHLLYNKTTSNAESSITNSLDQNSPALTLLIAKNVTHQMNLFYYLNLLNILNKMKNQWRN